ncbi:MAG: polyphosphate kinase 2 family protein [Methanospirillaceae archaeon]|nr:polyphosphate kinase 2 family protein [Methanospirillaceae archaeon]
MELKGPHYKDYMKRAVVKPDRKVHLSDFDTGWAQSENLKDLGEKKAQKLLEEMLAENRKTLKKVQEILYADQGYAILIILQGMDTAGKDGTIRHVMSGVNPQGCRVSGFKVPTAEEHSHHFLWRCNPLLPRRGEIGIFNRSYYEDVLVVKVHPDRLEELPDQYGHRRDGFWEGRYEDINAFEKHLVRNGTVILKFFLHISKKEQKKRLLDRLSEEDKYWKFSLGDLAERNHWDQYTDAYEKMLYATSTGYAPWFVVPADYKWVARTFVADVIVSAIEGLNLSYPRLTESEIDELKKAKRTLESE